MRADFEKQVWAQISRDVERYRKESEFIVQALIENGQLNQTALINKCVDAKVTTQGKARAAITKLDCICWIGIRCRGEGSAINYRLTDTGLIHYIAGKGARYG